MALTTSSAVVVSSSFPIRFEFSLCTFALAAAPFFRLPFPPPRFFRLATASG